MILIKKDYIHIPLPFHRKNCESIRIAEFLNEKSLEGLEFVNFTFAKLRFKIIEPQAITYFVDVFNSHYGDLDERRDEYRKRHTEDGWEFVDDYWDIKVYKNVKSKESYPNTIKKDEYIEKNHKDLIKDSFFNLIGGFFVFTFQLLINLKILEIVFSYDYLFYFFILLLFRALILFYKNILNFILIIRKKQIKTDKIKPKHRLIQRLISVTSTIAFIFFIINVVYAIYYENKSELKYIPHNANIIMAEDIDSSYKDKKMKNIDITYINRPTSSFIKKNYYFTLYSDSDYSSYLNYHYIETSNEVITEVLLKQIIICNYMFDAKHTVYEKSNNESYEVYEDTLFIILRAKNKIIILFSPESEFYNEVFYDNLYAQLKKQLIL